MHKLVAQIEAAVTIPFIHIADPVGEAARAARIERIGLLGTAFTMEQDFMKARLRQTFGLDVIVPEPQDREIVHRIIYDELCVGVIREASRDAYRKIMAKLASAGAQAIVLGCTEITLLVNAGDSALPLLDTTTLHALAAVEFALQDSEDAPTEPVR
jgi:aspartate racemase